MKSGRSLLWLMALAEEEEKKKQSHATFEHYVLCSDVRVAVIHSVF